METRTDTRTRRNRLMLAGVLLGLGLGGLFDGIVLHQVLQWHHMLSDTGDNPVNTVAGLEDNILWDGLFHLVTLALTLAGLAVLWDVLSKRDRRDDPVRWSTTGFVGTLLIGWGLFNLAEGVVNHHLLGIHHVREGGNELAWDLGFLAWGAAMLVVGFIMSRELNAPFEHRLDPEDRPMTDQPVVR